MAHGVRKVYENLIRDGRAIILTSNLPQNTTQAQWDSTADGTLLIEPATGNIKFKKNTNAINTWTKFLPTNIFDNGTIANELLKDKTIQEGKLADNSVVTRTIKDRNVTSTKIATGAITTEHITAGSLEGSVIKDNSINGTKLAAGTVTGNKLANNTITEAYIANSAVTADKIGPDAVETKHIKNLNVTTEKLAANSVTEAKIANLNITTAKIADKAITNAKLADNSVDWNNIKANAVRDSSINAGAVTEAKIATSAVTETKIKDAAVSTTKIKDLAVTNAKIADGTIQKTKLATDIQTILTNAVVHVSGVATVKGELKVQGNITATKTDKSQTITGFKVYNPVFADYAEGFVASEPVKEGDIVEIDQHGCVKKAEPNSCKIVGVVSERYGMCLDASEEELELGAKVAIGLIGKVPVNVIGTVRAGDFIVSIGDGYGIATKNYRPGCIIGKALYSKNTFGKGTVLCLIQPM